VKQGEIVSGHYTMESYFAKVDVGPKIKKALAAARPQTTPVGEVSAQVKRKVSLRSPLENGSSELREPHSGIKAYSKRNLFAKPNKPIRPAIKVKISNKVMAPVAIKKNNMVQNEAKAKISQVEIEKM